MSSPETEGPLETGDGPRCPNCKAAIAPGITLCPNCGAAMPPLPTLSGPPEENYLAGSRKKDMILGILTGLLTPVLFWALAGGLITFGERMGGIAAILGLLWLVAVVAVPILIQVRTKPRYPAFARAHGITWKVQGILFAVVVLGGGALCVYLLSQPH
jgi:hypothetical protein